MQKLTTTDLMTLETYARERPAFRSKVIAHKKSRSVAVGPNTTWLFEDRLTIHYQVQEMLRTERIFEPEGIAEELHAYNPLIPDGRNWKVTLLVEFADPATRPQHLARLKGIEDRCYVQVADFSRVHAIADEDLERENEEKTSSVHFLRFELSEAMIGALRGGARLVMGIDHANYSHANEAIADHTRKALIADFA
ncbi:MAG: DUF3501 family protein [Gammaproteobacteria bacterium]|jgi:hypothetical protein|nr:DUF3501 family protein [Gammaproteobacteria bacterium]NBP07234.1 DUF3501 family protein [Gammaproteobacteria bacterium]NBR17413.1 DUF3501 family protein [Gammaproteobacteria bacterium]NCW20220.1 DUF3501 family protein [Gammaproteobacteria bacterium]NCW56101.1 DUF3501 family protein [Gammaproteobacteria bacterium]